jgi:hypothetical protein
MIPKTGLAAVAIALALGAAAPALAASITVVTVSVPKEAQDFTYSIVGLRQPKLDDDAGAVGGDNTLSNATKVSDIPSGPIYEAWETAPPPGWALTAITCTGAAGHTANLATRRVQMGLTMHSHAVCTFVHTKVAP